jgi:hypothetical protein
MMPPGRSRRVLIGMLILAAGHAAAEEAAGQAPMKAMRFATLRKSELIRTAGLDDLGKRVPADHKAVDIFKGKSWYVAPPKPKPLPPPPPPPPTAPPVPYAYMGSYQGKDGRLVIFLTRGDKVYSVSSGDVLEGTYRVGAIESGQLVLIYLPLNIRQTINIGEAS